MNTTFPTQQPLSSSSPYPPLEPPYIEEEFSLSFFRSICQSFTLTLIAELGDKSFIMLIILQMKSNQITVFLSSLLVQFTMNICAAFVGLFIDYLLYKHVIDYVGLLCFLIYGLWLIGDSFHTTEKSFEKELLPVYSNKDSRIKPERTTTNLEKGLTIIPELTIDEITTQELNSSLKSSLLTIIEIYYSADLLYQIISSHKKEQTINHLTSINSIITNSFLCTIHFYLSLISRDNSISLAFSMVSIIYFILLSFIEINIYYYILRAKYISISETSSN